MSPQPLSKVYPKTGFLLAPHLALSNAPDLAKHILTVVSVGAQIETDWAFILTQLLKADPITGMAMYEALSGSEARLAALLAAAKARLSPDDFLLFQAVQRAIVPSRRVRNAFVHHLWATTPHLDDALLLVDPQAMTQ